METEQERSGASEQDGGEEKTDREEGGPTSPATDQPAPEEGAYGTRPNPMEPHE